MLAEQATEQGPPGNSPPVAWLQLRVPHQPRALVVSASEKSPLEPGQALALAASGKRALVLPASGKRLEPERLYPGLLQLAPLTVLFQMPQ